VPGNSNLPPMKLIPIFPASPAWMAVGFLLPTLSLIAESLYEPNPLTGLVHYPECRYIDAEWNDGDSFLVELPTGQQRIIRLYEADCIEKDVPDESQARRLRAQRRYFGISEYGGSAESSIAKAKELGEEAALFTRKALQEPFSVYTAHADARGGAGSDRIYAFVITPEDRSLAAELVRNGLARAFGVYRRTPDDFHQKELTFVRHPDWRLRSPPFPPADPPRQWAARLDRRHHGER